MKNLFRTAALLLCLCLLLALAACVFDGGIQKDLQSLQARIKELENSDELQSLQRRIEELENSADYTSQIDDLTARLADCNALLAKLKAAAEDLDAADKQQNAQIDLLQQQIDSQFDILQQQQISQFDLLKQQLDALDAINAGLQVQISALTGNISDLSSQQKETAAALQTALSKLAAAQAELTLLKNKVSGENKTYSMGEKVTFANNGIKYLDFTFVEAYGFSLDIKNPLIRFDCSFYNQSLAKESIRHFLKAYLYDVSSNTVHNSVHIATANPGGTSYSVMFAANSNSYGAGKKLLLLFFEGSPMAVYSFTV